MVTGYALAGADLGPGDSVEIAYAFTNLSSTAVFSVYGRDPDVGWIYHTNRSVLDANNPSKAVSTFKVAPIPGDTDGDGDVDAVDLATLGLNWAPDATDKAWSDGDFGADGDVDAVDLAALGLNWSPDGSGAAAPEPGVLALAAAGAAVGLRRRHLG